MVAESTIGSFTIRSSSVPAGATITKIVVTSSKSSGSTGNIVLYVAKDEDNGDGTFDRYIDNQTWASSLTFSDFEIMVLVQQAHIMYNLRQQDIQQG